MMTNKLTKLSSTEIAIAAYAVALLMNWSYTKHGEPIGVLTLASKELFGEELHEALSNIGKAERQYYSGALSNVVATRLGSLRAVVKFDRIA